MPKQLYEVSVTKKNYQMHSRVFLAYASNPTKAMILAERELKRNSYRGEEYAPIITSIKQITKAHVIEANI